MTSRNIMKGNTSFSEWAAEQDKEENGKGESPSSFSFIFSNLTSIQDNMTSQFQDLSNSLPEFGPLSADFRGRMVNGVYLFLGSLFFAALAVLIGLPTLILKPAKFVFCITLSTIFAASSVIVIQKPSVFIKNLMNGGLMASLPALALSFSVLLTLFVTVIIHKYVYVLAAGCLQILAMLYYFASFIPGGTQGLKLLLKTSYFMVSTIATPFLYMLKRSVTTCFQYFIS